MDYSRVQTTPKEGPAPPVLLVTEAYNLAEGMSEASFLRAVSEVEAIATSHQNVVVAVIDPTDIGIAKPLLARSHPHVEVWHLPAESYDGQKNFIGHNSNSEFVVFLDGDCRPLRDNWLDTILAPFADPAVPAVGGLTLYEDFSLTGVAMSVLDWGYLFGKSGQALGCYASNNVAFRRQTLLDIPIPHDSKMRCLCYKHSQLLERARKPVRLESTAIVLHELPDIAKERRRRGYDHVAALWTDPKLPETAWLADPETVGARLFVQNWELALERINRAPPELNIPMIGAEKVAAEMRRLMAIDKAAIEAALQFGKANGLNAASVAAHKAPVPGRRD